MGNVNKNRVAHLTLPPEYVSVMEGCGFTWGGRWHGAKIGNETTARDESCDPMHFELPVAGGDQASAEPADTVVVLDSSGSMGWNDPQDQRKNAVKLYLDTLPAASTPLSSATWRRTTHTSAAASRPAVTSTSSMPSSARSSVLTALTARPAARPGTTPCTTSGLRPRHPLRNRRDS